MIDSGRVLLIAVFAGALAALTGCAETTANQAGPWRTHTGRGVPVSAVTTNYPRLAPAPISVRVGGTQASTISTEVTRVEFKGVEVEGALEPVDDVRWAPGRLYVRIALDVRDDQEEGVYNVWFRCENDDGEGMKRAARQRIRHRRD